MENKSTRPRHGPRWTLLTVAVLYAILACSLLMPACQTLSESEHHGACVANLKRISVALQQYYERYERFPPAYVVNEQGEPWHSWRILLLPFLGHQELYEQYHFDEPWNGERNRQLLSKMPSVYGCPADTKAPAGATDYVAVIGPRTAWPAHCPMKKDWIEFGTSSTIHLLEMADADIPWLEPRDLRYQDIRKGFAPRHAERHYDKCVRVLMADGKVLTLNRDFDAGRLRGLLAARQDPLPGVDWPAIIDEAAEFRTEPLQASEMKGTDVMPHTSCRIVSGRNLIYCANFQILWDRLRSDVIGAPIKLEGAPAMAQELNQNPFPEGSLAEDSYVAIAGKGTRVLLEQIRAEMAKKLPVATPRLLPTKAPGGFFAYTYLQKRLPFPKDFDRLPDPLCFQATGGKVDVTSFGIEHFERDKKREWQLRRQVTVLDYVSDDDFILELSTKTDPIVLAKVPRAETLAKALSGVKRRIRSPSGHRLDGLEVEEPLVVPLISLFVLREYDELKRCLENPAFAGLPINQAMQLIRFQLDESGAILDAEGAAAILLDVPENEPPKPRQFVFDKPFLLLLEERDAEQPYLVMWIENSGVLVPHVD